jgi:hypothetical protein
MLLFGSDAPAVFCPESQQYSWFSLAPSLNKWLPLQIITCDKIVIPLSVFFLQDNFLERIIDFLCKPSL